MNGSNAERSDEILAGDLVVGAKSIARHLGVDARTVYYWASLNELPIFKIGASLCLRKSTMARWAKGREPSTADAPAHSLGMPRNEH